MPEDTRPAAGPARASATPSDANPRILVVCYSVTGRTRQVATEVARACGADLETIIDRADRTGLFGHLRSVLEAVLEQRPAIRESRRLPGQYDLIVVGTPVWARRMASPVRSWLVRHRPHLARVAFFCTSEGNGDAQVLGDLAAVCGQPPVATLALHASRIEQRTHRRRVESFASQLRSAADQGDDGLTAGRRVA